MSCPANPILVVDDNEMLAEVLAEILSSAGHEVIIATSGSDALERVQADSPCLVLCDMSMPGMLGTEVLRSLREDPATADLPVVLMSGSLQALEGLQPNAFLQKPFMPREVIRVIAELMLPARTAA
jgi:CheY-like chemotaxis protein